MGKPKTVPLARGLIAGDTDPIYGQLEISLINDKNIQIMIRRKPYTGHFDVSFSIPHTSLQSIVDVLYEASEKLDDAWLSRIAKKEVQAKHEVETPRIQKAKVR